MNSGRRWLPVFFCSGPTGRTGFYVCWRKIVPTDYRPSKRLMMARRFRKIFFFFFSPFFFERADCRKKSIKYFLSIWMRRAKNKSHFTAKVDSILKLSNSYVRKWHRCPHKGRNIHANFGDGPWNSCSVSPYPAADDVVCFSSEILDHLRPCLLYTSPSPRD